jgi:hypothetical protein
MKKIISCTAFALVLYSKLLAQQHSLQKLWVTDTILPVPESYDSKENLLYTSLMDGKSTLRDGKGGIAKMGTDGKIIDLNWIAGLNAPKGMGRYKDKLYVADLTEIVIIDIPHKKVLQKITVDSAKVLNDITIDATGIVYVSDPWAKKVFKLENSIASIYISNLIEPNSLKAIGNYLYMLDNGTLYKIDKQRSKQVVADGMDENTDGIEQIKKGEYIISCWIGVIYHVNESGKKQLLIDTRKEEHYSADIGYNKNKKIIYVPTLGNKKVIAYQLK